MTAKQYLSQIRRLRHLIKREQDQIADIRSMAESVGAIRYDKDPIQSSPANDAMPNYIIQLTEAETRAKQRIEEYLELVMTIRTQLDQITPGLYSDILYMRYIEGKNLYRIAEELNYDYNYIRKIHGRALQAFDRKFLQN